MSVDLSLAQAGDGGQGTDRRLLIACLPVFIRKDARTKAYVLSAARAACFSMLQDVENCLVTSPLADAEPAEETPRPYESGETLAQSSDMGFAP